VKGSKDSDRGRGAYGEVNLRRGFPRLGIGAAGLWLVFSTFAYVLRPYSPEREPLPGPAFSLTMDIALMAAAILGVPWIVSGFRSN
jgi:hypothetical protein